MGRPPVVPADLRAPGAGRARSPRPQDHRLRRGVRRDAPGQRAAAPRDRRARGTRSGITRSPTSAGCICTAGERLRRRRSDARRRRSAPPPGRRPIGFPGPGFSWSPDLLEVLAERGYRYDASTLPTYLGPAGSTLLPGHRQADSGRAEAARGALRIGAATDSVRAGRTCGVCAEWRRGCWRSRPRRSRW